jgi:hypothetical protein
MALFFLGLGGILYVTLLLVNAVAILNEERFLAKIGLGQSFANSNDTTSVKAKMISLIGAIRTLLRCIHDIYLTIKVPLIALNVVVIVYELILG